MAKDPRLTAFCDPKGIEVFRSVAYTQEIWRPDPFDVGSIHTEAREAFDTLVRRAGQDDHHGGRILLIRGPAGSGKTHLMRAFRNHLHAEQAGWFSYMQLTTQVSSYERYVLVKTIESLEQPYDLVRRTETPGLRRLSDAVVGLRTAATREACEQLGETDDLALIPELAFRISDILMTEVPALKDVDVDLLRAIVLLQSGHPLVRGALLRYLRCEDLAPVDRTRLGELPPRTNPEDAMVFLKGLGHLMRVAESGAFVVCVDQLEALFEDTDAAQRRARHAVTSLVRLQDALPNAIVVIACLSDYYTAVIEQGSLTKSDLDRIELDPPPIDLHHRTSRSDVEALIGRRLEHLYQAAEVPFREEEPLYPFVPAEVEALAGMVIRYVLNRCTEAQKSSFRSSEPPHLIVPPPPATETAQPPPISPGDGDNGVAALASKWNDYSTVSDARIPDDDVLKARLLSDGLACAGRELPHELAVQTVHHGMYVHCDVRQQGRVLEASIVGLCEKSPRGGGLHRQVGALLTETTQQDRIAVVARSTEYPTSARSLVTQRLGELIAKGGRRVALTDDLWRDLILMSGFERQHGGTPDFERWLRQEQPLTKHPGIQDILGLQDLIEKVRAGRIRDGEGTPVPAEASSENTPRDSQQPHATGASSPTEPIEVGVINAHQAGPFVIDPQDLRRHMGVLGGTGSGKTTLALRLIEGLVEQGIPAILLDRKGDLASYASPESWARPLEDSREEARRTRLRERADVCLYTPGEPQGCPLSLPLMPSDLADESVSSLERKKAAQSAALALGGMMNYRQTGLDATRLAILTQAILIASEGLTARPATLEDLVSLVHEQDRALLAAIGRLEPKHCKKLVEDLETLRLNAGALLDTAGATLDLGAWLGRRGEGERVPLTVISLSHLGDNDRILFWMARFLLELGRFARSHPTEHLQGVVLLDEADLYLPAMSKPATKGPLESGLKRFRSAGIGLMLATQNPGDLDYRSRDNIQSWFVGRIKEPTSIKKLRPLLQDYGGNIDHCLAGQTIGSFFALHAGKATRIRAHRSLIEANQIPEESLVRLASTQARQPEIS